MLRGLSVPTHRIDALGVLILAHDDAWDSERIAAEIDEMHALALAAKRSEAVEAAARQAGKAAEELTDDERKLAEDSVSLTVAERDEAEMRHPFRRYLAGETRFDPQATDQGPRGQVRILDYIKPGAEPTMFHLRRVGYADRVRLDPIVMKDPIARFSGWIRAGVERITCGSTTLWAASAGEPGLPEAWIERLAEADGGAAINLIVVAGACSKYSRPLDGAELPRSA